MGINNMYNITAWPDIFLKGLMGINNMYNITNFIISGLDCTSIFFWKCELINYSGYSKKWKIIIRLNFYMSKILLFLSKQKIQILHFCNSEEKISLWLISD